MLTFSVQNWFIPLSQSEPVTQCNLQADVKKLQALSVFTFAVVLVLGVGVGSFIAIITLDFCSMIKDWLFRCGTETHGGFLEWIPCLSC